MPRYAQRDQIAGTLARSGQRKVAEAFGGALTRLRSSVDVKELARLLRKAPPRAAIESALDLNHFRESLKDAFAAVGDLVERAGSRGVKELVSRAGSRGHKLRYGAAVSRPLRHRRVHSPAIVRKDAADDLGFDRFDAATQARLRAYQDELIRELEQQARDSIEASVLRGVREGLSVEEIAASIRDSISLTATQAQAVWNYRMELENGDAGALDRALRDPSFDNVAEMLIDGEDVSDKVINQMVDAYAQNYLDYRADTIAGTESLRAANVGLQEGYSQAIERGAIPADSVTRRLYLSLDEKTCQFCIDTEDMNSDGIAVDEPWDTPDGPMMNAPFHPNCRCEEAYETDVDLLAGDDDLEKAFNPDQLRDARGRWVGTGASSLPRAMTTADIRAAADRAAAERIARETARRLGYDSNKVIVSEADSTYTLGDETFHKAGEADLKTGELTIYMHHTSLSELPELMAHEIEHVKYQRFMTDSIAEYEVKLANRALPTPTYDDFVRFAHPHLKTGDGLFASSDGVTDYSRDWWASFERGEVSEQQAMHETMAELASLHARGEEPKFSRPEGWHAWGDLYEAVDRNWERRRRSRAAA